MGNHTTEQARSLHGPYSGQPLPSRFLLLSTPSLCSIPVLPITNEIHWLSSCLMSLLSVNSHTGPTSHFLYTFLFIFKAKRNGSEMKAVTLWLLVVMDVPCLIALGRGPTCEKLVPTREDFLPRSVFQEWTFFYRTFSLFLLFFFPFRVPSGTRISLH